MRFSVRLFICFILLAAVLLTEKFTNADTALQNLFYRPETHEWLINPALHQKLSPVFYKGLKFLLAATGAGCLIFLLLSLKKPSLAVRRRPVLILLLSIVFVPLVVAGAKYFTNVYCPYQLNIYNGLYPFVRIIDSYPESFVQPKPGRCFPAGHSRFRLYGVVFCFRQPPRKNPRTACRHSAWPGGRILPDVARTALSVTYTLQHDCFFCRHNHNRLVCS